MIKNEWIEGYFRVEKSHLSMWHLVRDLTVKEMRNLGEECTRQKKSKYKGSEAAIGLECLKDTKNTSAVRERGMRNKVGEARQGQISGV